jgi:Mn2+/Fe2+ NRAMP family transporter
MSKPRLWKVLGPGLITGAADDDPSGIATYSQAGAQFGFGLAWTMLFTYPLMVSIQAICARIGRTTGRGIAGNIRVHYANWVLQGTVAMLFIANTCNIGADLGAMTEASRLLAPKSPNWMFLALFSLICMAGQLFFKYTRYVSLLKWLTLSLFAYFAVLCVVHVPWLEFLRGLVWPAWSLDGDFWLMVVAILGTTISPYLFFWQASQEVEDTKAKPVEAPLRQRPSQGPAALARIRLDTLVGMLTLPRRRCRSRLRTQAQSARFSMCARLKQQKTAGKALGLGDIPLIRRSARCRIDGHRPTPGPMIYRCTDLMVFTAASRAD